MCKRLRIIILNIFVALHVRITFSAELQVDVLKKQRLMEKQSHGIVSPKMDYDEWTPIGRGDPLKNDPTFDYSPPMVGKVKYWINPLHRTPDPPILPSKELTSTESVGPFTATVTSVNRSSAAVKPPPVMSEIKRFYQDHKEAPADGTSTSYLHTSNPKFNSKLHRPLPQFSYQNHLYYNPTRQPPLPAPMLVPPPPIEPNSYSSSKIENSTTLELSWDNAKSHSTATATTTTTTTVTESTTSSPSLSWSANVASVVTKAWDVGADDKSLLQNLLNVERSTDPTTVAALTPNPSVFTTKLDGTASNKSPTHLIIQGHSKVKKYGGSGKLRQEKSSVFSRDTDENGESIKYELPKDARVGRGLALEDFLPIDGRLKETLKDIATNQAEGSGIGAELTKVLFPSYVRPSTTLVYESPRFQRNLVISGGGGGRGENAIP